MAYAAGDWRSHVLQQRQIGTQPILVDWGLPPAQDYLDDRYRIGQALKRHPGLAGKLELPSWYDQDWWASKTNMAVLWELLHQCQNWSYLIEEWREKDHMGEWLHSARVGNNGGPVVFAENQEKAKQLEESGQKGESAQATSGLGSDAQPARDDAREAPPARKPSPFRKGSDAQPARDDAGEAAPARKRPFRLEISVTTLSTTHPLGPTGSAPIERYCGSGYFVWVFASFSWRRAVLVVAAADVGVGGFVEFVPVVRRPTGAPYL